MFSNFTIEYISLGTFFTWDIPRRSASPILKPVSLAAMAGLLAQIKALILKLMAIF